MAQPEAGERRLSLTGHLEELRRRLWVCVGLIAGVSILSFAWTDQLVAWLKRPAGPALGQLAFFSPPEAFLAYMKVALTAGLFLSMPLVLYELWRFVQPALTRREAGYGAALVWWGSALFAAGGAFAYWVLLPVTLRFLLGFGGDELQPVISISRYLSFTTGIMLACGAVFQLPLVVFVAAKLGLVTAHQLRRYWRHALVAMLVAAALLTPTTDIPTMILMTVPMLVLYEASIWVATVAGARRRTEG